MAVYEIRRTALGPEKAGRRALITNSSGHSKSPQVSVKQRPLWAKMVKWRKTNFLKMPLAVEVLAAQGARLHHIRAIFINIDPSWDHFQRHPTTHRILYARKDSTFLRNLVVVSAY